MVNQTKFVSTLFLSSLSNNIKQWLYTYLKERTNFIISLIIRQTAIVGVPQGSCISPALSTFSCAHTPSPSNLITHMLMSLRFPIPTLTFLKWLKPWMDVSHRNPFQPQGHGRIVKINHIYSKIHHHPFHSSN